MFKLKLVHLYITGNILLLLLIFDVKNLFIQPAFFILIIISFIVSIVIVKKINVLYKHEHIYAVFFTVWFSLLYSIPPLVHLLKNNKCILNAQIINSEIHWSTGKHNYGRYKNITIKTENKQFNNRTITKLPIFKYNNLQVNDQVLIQGQLSTFFLNLTHFL